jgi:inorganic pyrophosphatase
LVCKPIQILEQIDDISRDQAVLEVDISESKKRIFDDLENEKEEIKEIQKIFIEIFSESSKVKDFPLPK